MRNIVGPPVSNSNYFHRKEITKLIYRRLDTGVSMFLSAPRRVGKTSIMYHLRDKPEGVFAFIYLSTEEIDNTELYFKRLFEALLNSDVVSSITKSSNKAKKLFKDITNKVKKIGAYGFELELDKSEKALYSDIFKELMKSLDQEDQQIVIMIDEFPSTVENIHQKDGLAEAVRFLKINRSIRQESAGGIQFIYTGSIGLPAIVKRLDVPESINDLNVIDVPPLSKVEAKKFIEQLLNSSNVHYAIKAIDYLIEKINWLMPFFIQLSVQELVDLYDQNQTRISEEMVDTAFDQICNRRNNVHFDSYYNRLKDAFSETHYKLAMKILNLISKENKISKENLYKNLNTDYKKQEMNSIIESLEYDGYIHLRDNDYTFNSPILQLWWNKYIRI